MGKFTFGGRRNNRAGGKPSSIAGRIGGAIFFLFFFAMGMLFEVLVGWEFSKAVRQRFWKQTPCTITASTIEEKPSSNDPYTFKVAYEYEFNSAKYASTTYKRGYKGCDEYHKADKIAKRYPPGKQALCYVNPADPATAVLKRGSLLFGFVLLFPLIFVLIGAFGIYASLFSRDKKTMTKPIAAKSPRRKATRSVGVGIFAILGLVGAGMLYTLTIRPIARTIDARNWIETPCKIISAQVRSHEGDDSTTYSIDIFYEYNFDGQTYKSSRYGFIGGSSSGYSGKAEVVNAYKKAKNPVCYVNPKDPSEAVLKRGLSLGLLICLIPLPFLAIGIGGIIHSIHKKKERSPRSAGPRWFNELVPASPTGLPVEAAALTGPAVLKPEYAPVAKLLGTIVFAVFWNGIVSIFVYKAINSFRQGRPDWGLALIMIPFVLIGLGAIGSAFYQFLATFNPRVTLNLSSATIPLGSAAELSWSFTGRTSVINTLRISLQAREEARYRRGTKTYTDKNKFYETELYSTTHASEIAHGSVGIIVPADTMHSFEATNNRIIWELQVTGQIDKWPDVKETFKITITP
ncbi:MAG: DUF3592 domain-containing protein [Sedimentisphaerales bacterium]|nr:DUF3592 domain-containing protein [Sedimentisphaerales bacterium]